MTLVRPWLDSRGTSRPQDRDLSTDRRPRTSYRLSPEWPSIGMQKQTLYRVVGRARAEGEETERGAERKTAPCVRPLASVHASPHLKRQSSSSTWVLTPLHALHLVSNTQPWRSGCTATVPIASSFRRAAASHPTTWCLRTAERMPPGPPKACHHSTPHTAVDRLARCWGTCAAKTACRRTYSDAVPWHAWSLSREHDCPRWGCALSTEPPPS